MGLFDSNKKQENEKDEEKLLGTITTDKLEYSGGYPRMSKDEKLKIEISDDYFRMRRYEISYENVTGVHYETMDQIGSRITLTRLALAGPLALIFKKKKKTSEKYLTIDYSENGIDGTIIFSGKNCQKAYSQFYARYSGYLRRHPKAQSEENTSAEADPYEEIKKAKELLDMGIITQEEFDQKKKVLLDL